MHVRLQRGITTHAVIHPPIALFGAYNAFREEGGVPVLNESKKPKELQSGLEIFKVIHLQQVTRL